MDKVQYAPKYRIVAEELRRRALGGEYIANQLIPSETELIKEFKVSRVTIRNALGMLSRDMIFTRHRGKGTFVSPHLGGQKSITLIFSYPNDYSLLDPYLAGIYKGFIDTVKEKGDSNGRQVSAQCISFGQNAAQDFYSILHVNDPFQAKITDTQYVQGLCLTRSFPDEEMQEIYDRGMPCVMVGASRKNKYFSTISYRSDDLKMGIMHLKELGHHDIGLVIPRQENGSQLLSHVAELNKKVGINLSDKHFVFCDDYKRETAFDGVMELLRRSDRPTALYCADDFLALGARDAALRLGLSVPQELSIVGAGDYVPESGLTTLSVPLEKMGSKAAELLIGMAWGTRKDLRQEFPIYDSRLIVRQSSGKAPTKRLCH